MRNTYLKSTILILSTLIFISCGDDKRKDVNKVNEPIMKEVKVVDRKAEENKFYKNAITSVLNAPESRYAYIKGETGINTFIQGDEIVCFLDTKNETPSVYDDRFFANVYKQGGKESLAFEYADFEKDDVQIGDKTYMLAAFKFADVDLTSSIQVGQYSKEQKKITWKVLIPKGRFHK